MQVELILLILSLLFFVSIIADKIGYKFGVPALLLFLVVGMLFGTGGLGFFGEELEIKTGSAQALSTVALCIILFSSGFDTKLSDIKPVLGPGITLATLGVLITCLITGVIIYFIFDWLNAVASISIWMALLMAATLSSTDSASVFSILRTHSISLKHNLRPLLELESGANDPMAYILTTSFISIVLENSGDIAVLSVFKDILVQLVMGLFLGVVLGKGLVSLLRYVQLANEALYPIMVLTACIFIFSVTYYLDGNTYLAVYVGGMIIGNSKFTRKRQTKSFFNGLAWLSQLVLFLMLGLMVDPWDFLNLDVWLPCLIISIVMLCISRPTAVFICMYPFKQYNTRDKWMLSWVGLKGAVPIVFAILCKAQGVPHADIIFNVVFLCTILSLLFQGMTITSIARHLHLALPPEKTHRLIHFDMDLPDEIQSTAHEVEVTEKMLTNGKMLCDVQIPAHSLIIMVRRENDFFVPTGKSILEVGDQLLIIADRDANAAYRQMTDEIMAEAQWRARLFEKTKIKMTESIDWMRRKMRNHHNTSSNSPKENKK